MRYILHIQACYYRLKSGPHQEKALLVKHLKDQKRAAKTASQPEQGERKKGRCSHVSKGEKDNFCLLALLIVVHKNLGNWCTKFRQLLLFTHVPDQSSLCQEYPSEEELQYHEHAK